MAGFNYPKSASTADRLIKRFGRPSQLTRETPGNGPAHNPGPPVVTNYPVTIAVLTLSPTKDNSLEEATVIRNTMRRVFISPKAPAGAALAVEPLPEDKFTFDNATWNILSCTPLNPAGVSVLYTAEVKKI